MDKKQALIIVLALFFEGGRNPFNNALVEIFQAAVRCSLDPRALSEEKSWQYVCQCWMK